MFKCRNCGGKVIFDIPSQQLKCEYCGSFFKIEEYQENNDASQYETNVYICQSCGAELTSPDEQVVSFCSYCGSQSMLPGKLTSVNSPKAILPFRLTRKQCQEHYTNKFKGVWYLPKEYKDASGIDSMRGIYMPFWSCSMQFPPHGYIKASRQEQVSSSSYYQTTYSVDISATNDKARYLVDASSALDDNITEEITPYPDQNMKAFNSAYLAGFYADKSDVAVTKYVPYLKQRATADVLDTTVAELSRRNMSVAASDRSTFSQVYQPQPKDYYSAMLPVWFLTHRDKDRVSYAVMNGYDGKMYADMPVDKKKYWLVTLGMAAVLFAVLALTVSIIAKTALGIAGLMTAIVMIIYKGQLKDLRDRETHAYDIGSKEYDGILRPIKKASAKLTGTAPMKKSAQVAGKIAYYIFFFVLAAVGLPSIAGFFSSIGQNTLMTVLLLIALVVGIIQFIPSVKAAGQVKDKSLLLGAILPLIAIGVSFFIGIIRPVDDWWYYLGCILCLAGAMIPSMQVIRCYNEIASRPLPTFFAREGGINDAKDRV